MSIFRKKHTQSYDKMNKKPVLKTSICTGEQVADIDTFKQMYGIDGEIPKVY